MGRLALEIHDADLLGLGAGAGEVTSAGPGYAFLDGAELRLGEDAAAYARLLPRRLYHRFWQQLDQRPLGRPWPRELTRADLAHAHLGDLARRLQPAEGEVESVLLAVPGTYSDEQLGLLLGLAGALGLPVEGMVDLAVAAALAGRQRPSGRLLHLDLHLHALAVCELAPAAEDAASLERRRLELVDQAAGLEALHALWAGRLAERFVAATRFDPLHSATSEQALHQQLPGWLAALEEQDLLEIALDANGRTYAVEIERRALLDAAEPFYRACDDAVRFTQRPGEGLTVLLAPSLAALPGVGGRLARRSGVTVERLRRGDAARGALRFFDHVRQPGARALRYLTALPGLEPAAGEPSPSAVEQRPDRPVPTHLSVGGLAYPIGDGTRSLPQLIGGREPLPGARLQRQDGRVFFEPSPGWSLAGRPVDGRCELRAGDRLDHRDLRGLELQLIAVVEAPQQGRGDHAATA